VNPLESGAIKCDSHVTKSLLFSFFLASLGTSGVFVFGDVGALFFYFFG
jgi:hypothetical protein